MRAGLTCVLLVLALCASACRSSNESARQAPTPAMVRATALSNHYVELAFAGSVTDSLLKPSLFSIEDAHGGRLSVDAVTRTADGNGLLITTGAQAEVIYRLTAPGLYSNAKAVKTSATGTLGRTRAALQQGVEVTFEGSLTAEPTLDSAMALSNTQVLLLFSEPMERASISDLRRYRIQDPDGDKDVEISITAVAPDADNRSVVITTTPQENQEYTIEVANVFARIGIIQNFINPHLRSEKFWGIPANDTVAPKLLRAESLGPTELLVSFSEPLDENASDPLRFSIFDRSCTTLCPPLVVSAAVLSQHGTQVRLTTEMQTLQGEYTLIVTGVKDRAGNVIDLAARQTNFRGTQQELTKPRVVGAISTGNTNVLITFTKPMGNSALSAGNYLVVQKNVNGEVGTILVVDSETDPDDDPRFGDSTRTSVLLTTSSQNEVTYQITAVNVRDLAGNQLAPADILVDPTSAVFAGTPRSGAPIDSDLDGMSDNAELRGKTVSVTMANGDVQTREVTSDPARDDTDGDGLTDKEESEVGSDPRSTDTDGDRLDDATEWNSYYSDPTAQDSDKDGLADGLEVIDFSTSPTIADTDGDQIDDGDEITQRNRSPLIADLPRPQILVDQVRLDLSITSSYTDEQGTVKSLESSTSTGFSQARSNALSRSDTSTTLAENESSQEIGFEVGYGEKGFAGKVTGKAGFGQKQSRGYTSTVSSEEAVASQQEYQKSVSEALSASQSRAVTRTIDKAVIQATVNIANQSDIAFSVTNIELAVLQQDRTGLNFRPIGVLRPAGTSASSAPTYNLGPFDRERGPIVFESVDVFPNLVDGLMREPTGLVFDVVNFDILDELGRNFVFSSQEVNDRTAGISIDFGNGQVESYRVATNSTFGDGGKPDGILLERALEIVGLSRRPGVDTLNLPAEETADSYGVVIDSISKGERLTRVRGVQSDSLERLGGRKFWAVLTSNVQVPADASFGQIRVRPGQQYLLAYTQDVDKDGLLLREEALYGGDDTKTDTDGDTLGDYAEVRTGWMISLVGRSPYKAFPSPARSDSDLDGLTDKEELESQTDPNRADTDEDGLSDLLEVKGPIEVLLFDGDADDTNNRLLTVTPYLGTNTACPGNTVATDGRVTHSRCYATDPLNADTDRDGLPDGREVIIGINPNVDDASDITDSDEDGLSDSEEVRGWVRVARCADDDATCRSTVTSNPLRADTDLDGVPDAWERAVGSDPTRRDTDGDGLADIDELDIDDQDRYYDAAALADAVIRCSRVQRCTFGRVPPSPNLRLRTNVNAVDSDKDTIDDNVELSRSYNVSFTPPSGTPVTRRVSSKPYAADDDADGVKDAAEYLAGTDPNGPDGFDTDQDGTSDGDELGDGTTVKPARCVSAGVGCRSPLRADAIVTFTYNTLDIVQDCDAESAPLWGIDLSGSLSVTLPNGTSESLQSWGCSYEGQGGTAWDDGTSHTLSKSTTFLMRSGETFRATSGNITDNDGDCITPIYTSLGQIDETFTFPTVAGAIPGGDPLPKFELAPTSDCSVRVNASISVR